MKIVLATGGFDPIHSGHISYLQEAKKLGDVLIVGLNSDAWLTRKKGRPFMKMEDRLAVISSLACVDSTIKFNDDGNNSLDAIRIIKELYPNDTIIFANGGDRNASNIPELQVTDIEFAFGVGGDHKQNSSSWILDEWKNPKTFRTWGNYRILYERPGTKVKELLIEPHQSLSMQRHSLRSEYWFVAVGSCQVETEHATIQLNAHEEKIKIPAGTWHRLSNPYDEPCHVIEIQYGIECIEEDIERKDA